MQNDKSDFKQPTRIYAEYTCSIAFEIDDICDTLGVKKEDIQRVNVKWNTMYLLMKNGDTLEYCLDNDFACAEESIDWKYPKSLYLLKPPFEDITYIDNPFKETDTDTGTENNTNK